MLALRMLSIRSIPAISSAETKSPPGAPRKSLIFGESGGQVPSLPGPPESSARMGNAESEVGSTAANCRSFRPSCRPHRAPRGPSARPAFLTFRQFLYPKTSKCCVYIKKSLFFLIKNRNFAVGLLLCSTLRLLFARPYLALWAKKHVIPRSLRQQSAPFSRAHVARMTYGCKDFQTQDCSASLLPKV